MGNTMRPARLHELTLPTRYALWRRYIHGTDLQNKIGPQNFTDLLNQKQAIELVDQKGVTLCKVLNESKIQATLKELYSRPYQSFYSVLVSKLVKQLGLIRQTRIQGRSFRARLNFSAQPQLMGQRHHTGRLLKLTHSFKTRPRLNRKPLYLVKVAFSGNNSTTGLLGPLFQMPQKLKKPPFLEASSARFLDIAYLRSQIRQTCLSQG